MLKLVIRVRIMLGVVAAGALVTLMPSVEPFASEAVRLVPIAGIAGSVLALLASKRSDAIAARRVRRCAARRPGSGCSAGGDRVPDRGSSRGGDGGPGIRAALTPL